MMINASIYLLNNKYNKRLLGLHLCFAYGEVKIKAILCCNGKIKTPSKFKCRPTTIRYTTNKQSEITINNFEACRPYYCSPPVDR